MSKDDPHQGFPAGRAALPHPADRPTHAALVPSVRPCALAHEADPLVCPPRRRPERKLAAWLRLETYAALANHRGVGQVKLNASSTPPCDPLPWASRCYAAGCDTTMAVRATNVALADLLEHALPGATATPIRRDIRDLVVAAMVEFQNDNVAFRAVHARVCRQVHHDVPAHQLATSDDLRDESRLLTLPILRVVRRIRDGETRPAPSLPLRLAASHRRELGERLRAAALRTRPHPQT
jgi:hypothetical protein